MAQIAPSLPIDYLVKGNAPECIRGYGRQDSSLALW